MIHSFLMIGQSNMAGRGFVGEVGQIFDEKIKMLRNGRWQLMWEPINPDFPSSGVGLAASFAAAWRLEHPDDEIGLIPCAEGGASLEDWKVGGNLFNLAVFQAKLAQQTSEIKGILWHQGENDCFPELAASYRERLSLIMATLRTELGLPEVPLIVGGLGDYLTSGRYGQYFGAYPLVNSALLAFANHHPYCYFVAATGLSSNPDGLHFDAQSQRVFGVRYFAAFHEQKDVLKPLPEENDILEDIYIRPLTQNEQLTLLEYKFALGEITLEALEAEQTRIKK